MNQVQELSTENSLLKKQMTDVGKSFNDLER